MSFKKPRSDAKLRSLPEAAHADLVRLLAVENMSQKGVIAWLKATHGVTTSAGALSEFWRTDVLAWKLTRAREMANGLKADLTSARPDFDKATIGLISQRAFELASAPDASPEDIANLIKAINDAHRVDMKREELGISKEKLRLLREKAKQADAAKGALADTKLSPEEKTARMKAIFGINA